jgi:uncharacterized protein YrrD
MLLTTASAVRGLPVVTVPGGDDVAEIRDIVYQPQAGRVVGFTLNKRGRLAGRRRELLPAAGVRAIGRDAVTIASEDALVDPGEAPEELGTAGGDRDVIGADVVTEGGVSLGSVKDVVLLVGGTGEVVGYQLERPSGHDGYIPLAAQLAVSGAALVVPNATAEFVREDLVGLGASVDEFRSRLDLR